MSIRISCIKMSEKQVRDWLNNEGFIFFEDEKYVDTATTQLYYEEALRDFYNETGLEDEYDYTFYEWCEENDVYTKWDINHQYGCDGWEWEVLVDDSCETQWLIVAVKEY